jgi:hypothetical protein
LSAEEKSEIDRLISGEVWLPLPGPQTDALESEADVIFYGGSAGGGKTDLLLGAALTQHHRSIIFRREGTQLQGIYDRLAEIVGSRDGFNSQSKIWRLPEQQVEFGSCQHLGDEQAYQGRPHDLKGFDEITHFLEIQFRFLCGWKRTTKKGQRCRVICTGNPPTDSDGQWVLEYWGPWLDKDYPNPAQPGEIRWFAMIDGKDTEVESGDVFEHKGEQIRPQSRTFIPSKVEDNVFLMETDYKATLQALPEPLRSQMLKGDFSAGMEDDPWQVIPTQWVEDAMARWTPQGRTGEMDSVGADPARGGKDETVIATRYGNWFDELNVYPGSETPNGPAVASLVVMHRRDGAPVHVDVIGIGSSVYDHLSENNIQTVPINNAEGSQRCDKSGKLRFVNKRAETWWTLRECLDPRSRMDIALPPDRKLKADLTAPRWKLVQRGIQIEDKEELKKRIGRSPDRGDAVVMANIATPKDIDDDEDLEFDNRQGRNETTGY